MEQKISFVNYKRQYHDLKEEIDKKIQKTLEEGNLILREDVEEFEKTLASFVGTKYAVGLNSGTDALILSLRAAGIREGDEVITVSHTFMATIASIVHVGAKPVLVEVKEDFEIIVVDNNSADVNKLMDYQTSENSIIYIKNDRNLGYSGGNNTGIKKALENGADWVLLLNNDTWAESSFVGRLRANLEGKEGIVGLALDEGNKVAYAGQIQWLKSTLFHITTLKVVMTKSVDKLY